MVSALDVVATASAHFCALIPVLRPDNTALSLLWLGDEWCTPLPLPGRNKTFVILPSTVYHILAVSLCEMLNKVALKI